MVIFLEACILFANLSVNGKQVHCKDTVSKIWKKISIKETARPQSQFLHSNISVSDLYISTTGLPIFGCSKIGVPINRSQMYCMKRESRNKVAEFDFWE